MTGPDKNRLIWIDLEMTGLDPEIDQILEVAIIVTDQNLEILAEFGPKVIHHAEERLQKMNAWCQKTHKKTGLWERVLSATQSDREVEQDACAFLSQWVAPGSSPACGSTVFHDRRFLARYMPKLQDYFHYRCIDVSTLKELAGRWKPEILKEFKKAHPHQALLDIRLSIDELKFYRQRFLNLASS